MYKSAKGFRGSGPSNFNAKKNGEEVGIVGRLGPEGAPRPKGKPKRPELIKKKKPPIRSSFDNPSKQAKAEKIAKKLTRRIDGVEVLKRPLDSRQVRVEATKSSRPQFTDEATLQEADDLEYIERLKRL